MNHHLLFPVFLSLLLSILFIQGCKENDPIVPQQKQVSEYSAEASLAWNKLFLRVERYAEGYRPCPAARALGYMGLASYEACVSSMDGYNSLTGYYPGMNIPSLQEDIAYHWPSVVHGVYQTMMSKFFTEAPPADVKAEWDALILQLDTKYKAEVGSDIFDRSKDYGISVGNAVYDWSTTDPYAHNAHKNPYFLTEPYAWEDYYDGPGNWVPTPPGPLSPIFSYFGKARTFALNDNERLSLPPSQYNMSYSEDSHSEYYMQALHAYVNSAAAEDPITEFWNDEFINLTFSSASRWISIANQIIEKENVPLDKTLEAYAKTGMALNDAAVASFKSIYFYNIERPATYIRKVIDVNYKTGLHNPLTNEAGLNPNFPSYPSSHATLGAAGAEALSNVFGYNYSVTDRSHEGRTEFNGMPRSFASLHEMSLENAWSRQLSGTNWYIDCVEGIRLGTVVAQKVEGLPWKN